MATMRNAEQVEALLLGLFQGTIGPEDLDELLDATRQVDSFADAGLLTRDRGIVLRFGAGVEFQITIVKSARGDGPDCVECGDEFDFAEDLAEHLIEVHDWEETDAAVAAGLT